MSQKSPLESSHVSTEGTPGSADATSIAGEIEGKGGGPGVVRAAGDAPVARLESLALPASAVDMLSCPACGCRAEPVPADVAASELKSCSRCGVYNRLPQSSAWPLESASFPGAFAADLGASQEEIAERPALDSPEAPLVSLEPSEALSRLLALCDRYAVRRRRLLELGGPSHRLGPLAIRANAFRHVQVIETDVEQAEELLRQGVNVLPRPWPDVLSALETPDVIVAHEQLEQLFAPADWLQQALAILPPGGLLIASVNLVDRSHSQTSPLPLIRDPRQVLLFTWPGLEQLVQRTGFEILDQVTRPADDLAQSPGAAGLPPLTRVWLAMRKPRNITTR